MNKRCFKRISALAAVVIMLLCAFPAVQIGAYDSEKTEKSTTFGLTEEEEKYVSAIRDRGLTLGVTDRSAYSVDENGLEYGTCIPVVNFLEYELDTEVEIVYGSWAEINAKLYSGEIDFMFGLPCERDGMYSLYYGAPIAEKTLLLVVNRDSCKAETALLSNISIGLVKDAPQSTYIRPYLHSVKSVEYFDGDDDMMKALESNLIDAAIITGDSCDTVFRYDNLKLVNVMPELSYEYTIGTAKSEYSAVLTIFNRFLTETDEGEAFYEELDAQKLWFDIEFFSAEEKNKIEAMGKRYDTVECYLSSSRDIPMAYYENGMLSGIYPDMIRFFSDITGLDFIIRSEGEETEELSKLADNATQAYFGLLKTEAAAKDFDFSDGIYENALVAAVSTGSPEYGMKEIPGHTWGVLSSISPLLETSVFSGHIREYPSEAELFEAVDKGEVDGMVLKQTILDYRNLQSEGEKYKTCTGISIPVYEYIGYSKENPELNELLNKLVFCYQVTHVGYEKSFKNAVADYQNGMISNYLDKVRAQRFFILACAIAAVLLVFIAVKTVLSAEKLRLLSAKLRVVCSVNNALDIAELNLSGETMRSTNRFAIFNIPENERREEYSLAELSGLTGYDFKAHYEKIVADDKNDFEVDFSIHSRGCKYFYREIGTFSGGVLVSTIIDMTDKETETNRLREKVEFDALTGLYNRNAYTDKVTEIIRNNPDKLGIFAFIDVNKFKHINDTYGHAVGDEILVSFAYSIRKLQKDENSVVFRIAGDEFGAFRGGLESEADLMQFLAELQSLSMGTNVGNEYITTTYSCGVSVYGQDAYDAVSLSELADEAMYVCKENKLSLVTFESSKTIKEGMKK